jgi:hypothetical protein
LGRPTRERRTDSEGGGLLRTLSGLDPRGRYVIVLRHAERHPTPERHWGAEKGWTRTLTERGHRSAREFGMRLPNFRRLTVAYSAATRCRQTALDIALGFRFAHRGSEVRIGGSDLRLSKLHFGALGASALRELRRRGEAWGFAAGATASRNNGKDAEFFGAGAPSAVVAALEDARRDPLGTARILVGHRVGLFRTAQRVFGREAGGRWRIRNLDGIVFRLGSGSSVTALRDGRRRRVARWERLREPHSNAGRALASLRRARSRAAK